MNTSKILLGASVLLLSLSAVFGVLNTSKGHAVRAQLTRSENDRLELERKRAAREKEIKAREEAVNAAKAKVQEDESRVAASEEDLIRTQTEKQELQSKLQANETEIAELRKHLEENSATATGASPPPVVAELQTQLADTKKQLETAEREKELLSDKINAAQERATQLETEKKRRVAATGSPGVRGTVLAVNQAYNFVVLNLGARHGLEANSEMLIVRGGAVIGKLRISSVEPATAIGDVVSTTLARGVQVQPGDTVIYAGSNS